MKQVNNFQECLEYVNRLGVVNPYKPIGWRQSDLCKIVEKLETAAVNQKQTNYPYPLTVVYHRAQSQHHMIFKVNGCRVILKEIWKS